MNGLPLELIESAGHSSVLMRAWSDTPQYVWASMPGEAAPLGVLGGVVQVWELGGAPLVSSFIWHGLRLSMGFEPLPTTESG